jgi:hypothetical protein
MIRASPGLSVRGSGFSNPRERFILQRPGFSPGENAPSSDAARFSNPIAWLSC